MNKLDIDLEVAQETGGTLAETSQITSLFLKKVMLAIAEGEPVVLTGFGRFTRTKPRIANTGNLLQYKDSTPLARLGGCFGVHFSKARTDFTRTLRQHKEKTHGQARSR